MSTIVTERPERTTAPPQQGKGRRRTPLLQHNWLGGAAGWLWLVVVIVPIYWIVDADELQAEVWTPADSFPRFERERLTWHPRGAAEPFSLSLAELFRPV